MKLGRAIQVELIRVAVCHSLTSGRVCSVLLSRTTILMIWLRDTVLRITKVEIDKQECQ